MTVGALPTDIQYPFWLSLSEAHALQIALASAPPSAHNLNAILERLDGLLTSQVAESSEAALAPELDHAQVPIAASLDEVPSVENARRVNGESS